MFMHVSVSRVNFGEPQITIQEGLPPGGVKTVVPYTVHQLMELPIHIAQAAVSSAESKYLTEHMVNDAVDSANLLFDGWPNLVADRATCDEVAGSEAFWTIFDAFGEEHYVVTDMDGKAISID